MRRIAIFLIPIILIQTVSNAFVTRDVIVTVNKVIPFSFVSENQNLEEDLSIKGLNEVKIEKVHVDNGEVEAKVSGNYIEMNFSNGKWENSYKTLNKAESIELEEVRLTDEVNKKIVITPEKSATKIQSVSGDFSEAKILDNGNIEITVDKAKDGVWGYDEAELVKSEFTVNIEDTNINREVESEIIVLPYNIEGNIAAKSGDTSAVEKIYADGNEVKILFNNGVPKENENTIKSGYTYFWIDRDEEGIFSKYNPNSIYSTDINKITGLGEYIDEGEFDEIGLNVSHSNWRDYCGIEKNGVRYIYVFDKSKGIPKSFLGQVVDNNVINFYEQELNSEKLSVKLSNTGVSYVPEGKLYSVGELVSNTSGWGEIAPNREWESNKTFFNELTGKLETYIKHFKFFYGPTDKKTFGGYYTYPYNCTFEYQHYKPVKKYSGEICYEYESKEKVKGYSYNGWIMIEYKEQRNVNDYPPTSPYNVKYDSITGKISWCEGSDDYTPVYDLKYEIQIFDGQWKSIATKSFSELLVTYKIDYLMPDVRIRTVDEVGQVSDWSYASKNEIELLGELRPCVVKAGESIDIFATTKSLAKIQKVVAKNDEMQMYSELQKVSEVTPSFLEMSYNIEEDLLEEKDFLVVTNGRAAIGDKEDFGTYKFTVKDEFSKGKVSVDIRNNMEFSPEGTLIFSNLNYDDIPIDMFYFGTKYWHINFDNNIYIKNKITDKNEIFVGVTSDTQMVGGISRRNIIPYYKLVVNNFEYDEEGKPTYSYITVDKEKMSKPFAISWNTDAQQITTFDVYLGDELLYTYTANWNDIYTHVDKFNQVYMYKKMRNYSKATYGYIKPSSVKNVLWNEIPYAILGGRNLQSFTWLGFRIRNNEYVNESYVDEYNSNPNIRNNYRLLISKGALSGIAIKRYMDILKTTNVTMTNIDTVFGDDAMEYTSAFEALDINVPHTASAGKYEIDLIATDIEGKTSEIKLTLLVEDSSKEDNTVENDKEEVKKDNAEIKESYFGRFFYKEDKGYLEELKKTETTLDTNGFVCAGETIGFTLITNNTDYIEVDFIGDSSIKTLDNLTEKFLIDIPAEKGKDTSNIKYEYSNFPKKIYPQYVDNDEIQVFKWFYTIPYKTKQSLESWSSLKNSRLEDIDILKLFSRITRPYELAIYLNGDSKTAVHLPFDVFERWDTILNRDVTKYIVNSDTKWEMRIDK